MVFTLPAGVDQSPIVIDGLRRMCCVSISPRSRGWSKASISPSWLTSITRCATDPPTLTPTTPAPSRTTTAARCRS